jgi:LysM repeat protein
MKIIIPFKKEVVFKDNISEITSISLEHHLTRNDYLVKGNFLITGEYKVSDASITVLPFNLELPIALSIEDRYDTNKAVCDIDDFYYEIINDRKLSISIDISVDKLSEKDIKEVDKTVEVLEDSSDTEIVNVEDNRCIDMEEKNLKSDNVEESLETNNDVKEEIKEIRDNKIEERETKDKKIDKADEVNKKIKTLFNTDNNAEEYITYQIYIIRDGDTVDSIIAKYDIDVESLKEYNDISDLKIGDKIIIPRS